MPITVTDLFFKVTSNLTGGFVTDFTTAIFGVIEILLIIAAFNLIKNFLNDLIGDGVASNNLEQAKWAHLHREHSDSGSFEYDYYNSLYQQYLRKGTTHRSSTSQNSSRFGGTDFDV